MASICGLRILQKNLSIYNSIRSNTRLRRIPRRIFYYSRYANQLNLLRSNDRLYANKIPDHSQNNSENIERVFPRKIYSDPLEFNENSFIYRHIHKRLDKFSNMGEMLKSLPVESNIRKLQTLVAQTPREPSTDLAINELVSSITYRIKSMNQQELAIVLTAIKANTESEFVTIKKRIDIELRWLLKKHVKTRLMDLDLWFYLADIFYECLLPSNFVHVLANYLSKENEVNLSNSQFLHLLFLVILQRQQNGILSDYEERISRVLDSASLEELAIISLAYFKTKTPIKSLAVLRKIIDRLVEQLPNIDPLQPAYCSIIKALRYSRNPECRERIQHLIMNLTQDFDRRIILSSAYNTVHTVKLMETYRIYDVELLNYLANSMFRDDNNYRIKDIQYGLTSLSNFCYQDLKLSKDFQSNLANLCHKIATETRDDAPMQYPHLMPLLRAFSIFNYYNDTLMSYINHATKEPYRLQKMSKAIEFDRTALLVYVASRLEGGQVPLRGNYFNEISSRMIRLGNSGSAKQDSSIKYLNFLLKPTNQIGQVDTLLYRSIAKSLSSIEEFKAADYKFNFQYTMPHQNYADLIITKGCQAVGSFDEKTLMPKRVPADERHCLILATRTHDYVDGYQRLSGYKRLICRLLGKLGYTVMTVDIKTPDIVSLSHKIKLALGSGTGSV